MGNDRASTDSDVVADSYTRANRYITANPDIIADMNRLGILQSFIALLHIERMSGGIERAAWRNEDIIAESHLCLVEDGAVGIGKEVIAHLDLIAIIAEERSHDNKAITRLAEEFLQPAETLLTVVWRYLVNLETLLLTTVQLVKDFGVVVGIVKHACLLFFFLCHNNIDFFCPQSYKRINKKHYLCIMEFRTKVDIDSPDFKIQPRERMLFVGSCFADNLGKRFTDEGFPAVVNPYGVMYNPASILHTVQRFVKELDASAKPFIPSTAFFTLGTNHVYIEKATGEIVDNCRKRPQKLFHEELLSINDCYCYLREADGALHSVNPDIHVVVTVSPIRYRKYGYHESQLSKSILLLAADKLVKNLDAYYFPAYEIVNDELRDYRFYKDDMLHPSDQAVEYIWERFSETCFSARAMEYLQEWKPVKEALGHRPFHPESDEYKAFMTKTQERIKEIEEKYGRQK